MKAPRGLASAGAAGEAAVQDVERAGEDRQPAGEKNTAAGEGEPRQHADDELRIGEMIGPDPPVCELLLDRLAEPAVPGAHAGADQGRAGVGRAARLDVDAGEAAQAPGRSSRR